VETSKGELEEMNDEQYAAYVQTKMWEKKNPHVVRERERTEKIRKEEEQDTARRREEHVRRKQRAAWERAQEKGGRRFAGVGEDDTRDYEYVFDFDDRTNSTSKRSSLGAGSKEFQQAWSKYLAAWEELKTTFAHSAESATDSKSTTSMANRIPWPVLPSKPVITRNIEAFFEHIPTSTDGDRTRLQLLKVERVRWHPDKIQHRFGGNVDQGTMKIVTGIFQIVDDLVEQARKREERPH
jgi:hypothetical protein